MPFMIGDVTNSPDKEEGDAFSQKDDKTTTDAAGEGGGAKAPETFEELPIEIRSLTER
jgi:hypothetical protein